MSKLRLLDLFSGIGGFSLGLERTGGFETVAFCEIEEFPRKVLKKHWPEVPCYHDIRDLTAARLRADGIEVDAICGGFPCQDISSSGDGAGLDGAKSALWSEYARLVSELRPQVVFVENSAKLLSRGLDRVLSSLAEIGYDAEWHCVPASAVGATHHRDRAWIIAYPNGERRRGPSFGLHKVRQFECLSTPTVRIPGVPEPAICGTNNGVPDRSHRLKALGNAVVPQIPELLGNAYLESIGWKEAA